MMNLKITYDQPKNYETNLFVIFEICASLNVWKSTKVFSSKFRGIHLQFRSWIYKQVNYKQQINKELTHVC